MPVSCGSSLGAACGFGLIAFVILQRLRLHPKETLGEVKERLQRELFIGGIPTPVPLRGKVPAAQLLTA